MLGFMTIYFIGLFSLFVRNINKNLPEKNIPDYDDTNTDAYGIWQTLVEKPLVQLNRSCAISTTS